MATTLCIRSTDCLAGSRASFGAHRGVRAAPALGLAPRSPTQHESRTLAMAMNSRAARGRANGQQRSRRRSPPAAGAGSGSGSPPHKRVMENVVLLRRGQVLMDVAAAPMTATASAAGPSVAQAVPEKAETPLARKDAGVEVEARQGEREKVDDSVAAAKQSSVEAEKCEAVAPVDQGGAQEEEEEAAETAVTADNVGTETKEEEPVVTTNQSGAETTMEENEEPQAAAGQSGAQEEEAAETVVAADIVGTETKEEEPVVTTNQGGAETTTEENEEPEAAAGQSGAQAETAELTASVDHPGPGTRVKEAEARGADAMKAEPAPAAYQTLPLAKEEEQADQAYSGASFAAVAPDPRALPIPLRLLKLPRGGAPRIRVLALDSDRAPAATAAAA